MHFKHFESVGHNVLHFVYPVKKLSPIHTKINEVQGTVIYNVHTKFEHRIKRMNREEMAIISLKPYNNPRNQSKRSLNRNTCTVFSVFYSEE